MFQALNKIHQSSVQYQIIGKVIGTKDLNKNNDKSSTISMKNYLTLYVYIGSSHLWK